MPSNTTHYNWVKPDVAGSPDVWGGNLNSNLDQLDATLWSVQASVPAVAAVLPLADGVAAIGSSAAFARADHVHPAPTVASENRIINGDMRIDQRNNGASGVNAGYTIDRWQYMATQSGKGNWGRNLSGGTGPTGYYLGFGVVSAYTPLATDTFLFNQPIEADTISDLSWGTPQAQSVTLSFWVDSSLAGTFSGAIANYGSSGTTTRSYPFTYSIPTAQTWTQIAITIPGDTIGLWVMGGNGGALIVRFDLGSGANYRGPAGAWMNGNIVGATGAVSVVASNGATFNITSVKLEVGSVATPFNRQSLAKSMADCQRYYEKSYDIGTSIGTVTTNGASHCLVYAANNYPSMPTIRFNVTKRAVPTVTSYSTNSGASGMIYNNTIGDVPSYNVTVGMSGVTLAVANTPIAVDNQLLAQWTADAEL